MKSLLKWGTTIGLLILSVCLCFENLINQGNAELARMTRRIRPGASEEELLRLLGPPDRVFEAPSLPPWVTDSALGEVETGRVLMYTLGGIGPKLLFIHVLPKTGVRFYTWTST